MKEYPKFSDLVGKTLIAIDVDRDDCDSITFVTDGGERYQLAHYQVCCEHVYIADTVGNVDDLIGSPLTLASESSSDQQGEDEYDSATWTFYLLATVKGYVTFRWIGTSNGYYSEAVNFDKVQ